MTHDTIGNIAFGRGDRVRVELDTFDPGASRREQRAGLADAGVEIPDHLALDRTQLLDGEIAYANAHRLVDLFEHSGRNLLDASAVAGDAPGR